MQTGLLMVPGQGIVNRLGRAGAKKQFVVGSQFLYGPDTLAEVEKRHILAVLAQSNGSKARAADLLGVSRKTLDRKCAEWGV